MQKFLALMAAAFFCTSVFVANAVVVSAQNFIFQNQGLRVLYNDPKDAAQLKTVFAIWQTTKQELKMRGLSLPDIEIVAAKNAKDFFNRTNQKANTAAITEGKRITTQRLGALAVQNRLPLTLRHEFFHAAQPSEMPRWLGEGLARIFSNESKTDAASPTQFAALSPEALNKKLQVISNESIVAYIEASQRAQKLLKKFGWKNLLKQFH